MRAVPNWGWRIRNWWAGRDFRRLWEAVPAGGLGLGTLLLTGAAMIHSGEGLHQAYYEQARAAARRGEHAQAHVCYDRLVQLTGGRADACFGLAQAALACGEPQRACSILSELAPLDRPGHAEAHFWLARQLLSGPVAADVRALAERHLLRALQAGLEDPAAAHAALGQLYHDDGRLDLAEFHLLRAVGNRPLLRLVLARLYQRRNSPAQAREQAEQALRHYRGIMEVDPHNQEARLAWAEAVLLLDQPAEAVAILRNGSDAAAPGTLHSALSRAYAAWTEQLTRSVETDPAERLRVLEEGLRHDPANLALLTRLAEEARSSPPLAERAEKILQEMLARGQALATVHFVLGCQAYARGENDRARLHLEQAYVAAPQMPVIANNLAWVLAVAPNPDLARARQLIEQLLERYPDEPRFRGTRGLILAQAQRWREALPDLEAALPSAPDNPELHRALADVYENLGDSQVAAEHRRLATKPARSPSRVMP